MRIYFVETKIFTKQITQLLSDEQYFLLQKEIADNPEKGSLIRDSGGLRKIRFAIDGIGKSGGIRVIYYYFCQDNQIYFLLAYQKSKKDDLNKEELSILKKLVQGLKNG